MERVFLEEYPELREFDTFRVENTSQKTGKYRSFSFEFREKETCVILSKILNAKTFQAGHTLLLNVLIQGSALNIALKKAFFRDYQDQKLLSLAMFLFCEKGRAFQAYQVYAENNLLPWLFPLTEIEISDLIADLRQEKIDLFVKSLKENSLNLIDKKSNECYYVFENLIKINELKSPFQGTIELDLDLSAFNKRQVCIISDQTTGDPLYYETTLGENFDLLTLGSKVKNVLGESFKDNVTFVLDPKHSSFKNILTLSKHNLKFLLNVKSSSSFVKKLIFANLKKLEDLDSYDSQINLHVVTKTLTLSYPQKNVKEKDESRVKKTLFVHLFYDSTKHLEAYERGGIFLKQLMESLYKGAKLSFSEKKIKDRYLIETTSKDGKISYVVNESKFREDLCLIGFKIVVSNCESSAFKAYCALLMQKGIGQSFSCNNKDVLGSTFIYSRKPGMMLLNFLVSSFALKLKAKLSQSSFKEVSAPLNCEDEIIECLKGIKAKIWQDKLFYTEVTYKRQELLDALKLTLPDPKELSAEELELLESNDNLGFNKAQSDKLLDSIIEDFL